MFFVDSLTYCGGSNPSIIGCGEQPGNKLVVKSSFAAGSLGDILLAHELGHNLGLDHVSGTDTNLMNPSLDSSSVTTLEVGQVSTILGIPSHSPLGHDASGYFFSIRPMLVVATTPLPASLPLFAGGLSVMALVVRRRRRRGLTRAQAAA